MKKKEKEKEYDMNTSEKRKILIQLCKELTKEIIRNRKSLDNQCGYAAEQLRKRARRLGIKLVIQGGLWKEHFEHNWCIDPTNGDIYDPTAEQFHDGKNGLQTFETISNYTPVTGEEAEILIQHARRAGWTSRHTEGISQIAVGFEVRKKKLAMLDEFKKFYPTLKHVVEDTRGDELKTAKNGCLYAIIRFGGITFNINEFDIVKGKNNVFLTGAQLRSAVVFKNANGSYSIYEIEQRLYVTQSGKTGLSTRRGDKHIGYKISKSGNIYKISADNIDGEYEFRNHNTKNTDAFAIDMIKRFQELTK